MSCAFFRPVRDENSRWVTGVLGYCMGCPSGEVRVPSLEEYSSYCTGKSQAGCPVYESRKGLLPEDVSRKGADLIPRA